MEMPVKDIRVTKSRQVDRPLVLNVLELEAVAHYSPGSSLQILKLFQERFSL